VTGAGRAAPLIEVRGLTVLYGRRAALAGVDLELAAGSRTALLGPNGAGKSTLMRVLGGALAPDRGLVRVGGLPPERFRRGPRNLGWLAERAPLSGELTVAEHLELAGRLRGLGPAETRAEIGRLASYLSLGDKLRRLAGDLSTGSRRQAALAAALLGRPRLVVLDEPASGLDPDEARRLWALLADLDPEATMIISSHLLAEAGALAAQAVILDSGRLRAFGAWENLAGPGGGPEAAWLRVLGPGAAGAAPGPDGEARP
jgi:ABC-type multidrug transport system ATPase subunit